MTTALDTGRRDDAAETGGIPLTRLVRVELRKMFDTRAGFWLMVSIAVLALAATIGVILIAEDSAIEFGTFAAAIGVPMSVILPVIALLAVTSEWSQRTGLVTFTLEPRRGRVVLAKALAVVLVGAVSILVAFGIGAVGNVVGAAITGVELTWAYSVTAVLKVMLGNVLGLLTGFAFGALLRSSAAALVAYFVYGFVLTSLSMLLAANQAWYATAQPWVDFSFAETPLFNDDPMGGAQWAHLGVSGLIWLVLPLAIGSWAINRSEIK